ncbi:hypothetical protein [Trebonia sp.]|uniref:hypothetical protein n=1 Tax=Trebonia sp. TaxID=2767075 RepID=UPI0026019605|nr:hypothetical protein [Trebonia sp.]
MNTITQPKHQPLPTSAEGSYLAGPGRTLNRHIAELRHRQLSARVRSQQSAHACTLSERVTREQALGHRGGSLPWLLRCLIPVGITVEAATAYVGVAAIVTAQALAVSLSALTAFVAAGTACLIANRRLNRLPVPAIGRVLEAIFVAVLFTLRYGSLRTLSVGALDAGGAATLALLISTLGLAGIEEIVVETQTLAMWLQSIKTRYRQWRHAAAAARLRQVDAGIEAALARLEQDFIGFLLWAEGLPLDQASERAAALRAAMET